MAMYVVYKYIASYIAVDTSRARVHEHRYAVCYGGQNE